MRRPCSAATSADRDHERTKGHEELSKYRDSLRASSCVRGRGYCCCWGVVGFAAKSVEAFDVAQLKRLRDSMKRPAFERAPNTTTATSCLLSGSRSTVARQ